MVKKALKFWELFLFSILFGAFEGKRGHFGAVFKIRYQDTH